MTVNRPDSHTESIATWLTSLDLHQYIAVFDQHEITPEQLSSLDHELLKEMGIHPIGHRIKILDSLAAPQDDATDHSNDPATAPVTGTTTDHGTVPDSGFRTLSVVFIDLADSTRLSESIDPEAFRRIILAYQETCSAALTQHGGFIARYFGDGILAYFGYPKAFEDDAANAARAALQALAEFEKISPSLHADSLTATSIRIGIATGQTLVGDIVGEGASQEATAVGRVPNMAARVQSKAAAGQIMLCPETAQLLQGRFSLTSTGSHQLKGIQQPQELFQLLQENAYTGRFERHVTIGLQPLVGRQQELEYLQQAINRDAKQPVVTTIIGDAGIGKSRLIHEYKNELRRQDYTLLTGHCTQDADQSPYRPFIDLIKRFCDRQATLSPNHNVSTTELLKPFAKDANSLDYLLHLMGERHLDPEAIPPELSGLATENALLAFLHTVAATTTAVVFIEDTHWIDNASAALIERYLSSSAPALNWIFTSRPVDSSVLVLPDAIRHKTLTLQPLNATEINMLVENCLQQHQAHSDTDISDIVSRCDGNPLFAEEIARHVANTSASGNLPATIDSLLQQQFDQLEPALQNCLRKASVLGRQFELQTLEQMSAEDPSLSTAVESLMHSNILARDDESEQLVFKHALIRDTVYHGMLQDLRKELHLSAARAFETIYADNLQVAVDALASHYQHTNDTAKKTEYLIRSGDRALTLYSLDAAETRFEQVLSILENNASDDNLSARGEIVLKLSRVYYFQHNFKRINERIQPYLQILSAPQHSAIYSRLLSECGYANVFRGACAEGVDQLQTALKLGEARQNQSTIGYANLGLSWYYGHWHVDDHQRTDTLFVQCFEKAAACGRQQSDLWLESKAWMSAGCYYMSRGRYDDALKCAEHLYALSKTHDDPRPKGLGLYVHSMIHCLSENYEAGLELANTALETSISPLDRVTGQAAQAYARLMLGEHEKALADFRRLLERVERTEFRVVSYYNIETLYGLAQILSGSMRAGELHILDARRRYKQYGLAMAEANAHYFIGRFYSVVTLSDERPPLSVMMKNATYLMRIIPRIRSLAIRELTHARHFLAKAGNIGLSADAAWLLYQLISERNDQQAEAYLGEAKALAQQAGHHSLLQMIETATAVSSPAVNIDG
jgi:class 3 adenylate cyclase/tetratricopeptide (TPR) repeat protein